RDVHAGAQRVRSADDLKESLLGELFHQETVFGKESGVVNADAKREEAPELLAIGRREAPSGDDLDGVPSGRAVPPRDGIWEGVRRGERRRQTRGSAGTPCHRASRGAFRRRSSGALPVPPG